ncbi:protein of unknown function DUF58 [Shewanella halifaxensis HAW-EB4]|uniref:Uncharacterized protein n=1 Tax=Shewanella halifaxensis (strain HAW-EB4) TaxID=458817 RepID=B0TRK6_SHEHH|nr:DUF58 domain-containing protein [Shewanella halifaxensis]ABZ76424.1 protein of unknown function DUF58 [Shewanella halifaxensis HAW-EB4]
MQSRSKLNTKLKQIWQRWISRRIPAKEQITLSHKSIFILPTGFGLAWIFLFVLLFLFGTNYQNNLVMGLSFLLLSIFNTCIIYSYKNLAGLTLSSSKASNGFAGQAVYFPINLSSPNNAYEIQLNFQNQPLEVVKTVNSHQTQTLVTYNHSHRGINRPGRIKIETRYPLGLCRAWSHIDLALAQLAFTQPIIDPNPIQLSANQSDDPQDTGKYVAGVDEYKGLKEYQVGEPLKQVAWKQWAQGRGMLTKEFEEPQGAPMWLSLQATANDIELALSHLSWHTEQLSAKNQAFGLIIDGVSIPPAHGEQHRVQVQTQLALFSSDGESPELEPQGHASHDMLQEQSQNQSRNHELNTPQPSLQSNAKIDPQQAKL